MIGKVKAEAVPGNPCLHNEGVDVYVEHNYLKDSGRYSASVKITCSACLTPFRFLGLPMGLDLGGAAVSPDGTEGRFAIAPGREPIPRAELGRVEGFGIKFYRGDTDPSGDSGG